MLDDLDRPTRFWYATRCAIVLLLQPMALRVHSQERVNQNVLPKK
jgi:hypothetical protein